MFLLSATWRHITSHDKTDITSHHMTRLVDKWSKLTARTEILAKCDMLWHGICKNLPPNTSVPQPTACQRLQVARWPCVTNDGSDCLVVRPGWALQWTNTSEGAPRGYCEGQGRSGVAYGKWKLQKRTAGRKNRCQLSIVSKPLGTLYWSVTVLTKTCQIFRLFLKIEVRLFPYLLCRMISPSTWPYWSD